MLCRNISQYIKYIGYISGRKFIRKRCLTRRNEQCIKDKQKNVIGKGKAVLKDKTACVATESLVRLLLSCPTLSSGYFSFFFPFPFVLFSKQIYYRCFFLHALRESALFPNTRLSLTPPLCSKQTEIFTIVAHTTHEA